MAAILIIPLPLRFAQAATCFADTLTPARPAPATAMNGVDCATAVPPAGPTAAVYDCPGTRPSTRQAGLPVDEHVWADGATVTV